MRRTIDILVACVALAALVPLLLTISLIVVLESFGNPLYMAWRVGINGRKFRMFKFRTMVNDAAKAGSITGRNDPRITRVGRVLRRTKLDELPQFLNLFLGDMTLVGPRPESPDIVARYVPRHMAVLCVKPGVTGPTQLDGEESDSMPEGVDPQQYYLNHLMDQKIQRDIAYVSTRTFLSDLGIVLRTVLYILRVFVAGLARTLRREQKQPIIARTETSLK